MTRVAATLTTSGMHCSSCAMLVDITVGELEGVESVKTDHATGLTEVTYDDAVVSVDIIVDGIRGAGYEAEPA